MSVPVRETTAHGRPEFAGLSSAQAASVRAEFGPNAVVEEAIHPLVRFARHFWAPVPWMLEATIGLQIILGAWLTASMIAALLLFNVLLAAFQESRANAALALLKRRLTLTSRVRATAPGLMARRPTSFPAISSRFRSGTSFPPTS